jgi:hypothetical protein
MRISKITILKMKGQRRKKENSYTKQIEGTEVNITIFLNFFAALMPMYILTFVVG